MTEQFDQHLAAVESWIGVPLADSYKAFLSTTGGQFVGGLFRFYSIDELIDRNECYQTREYCPGFMTIGDDSGGSAIVINPGLVPPTVFLVDHGSMSPADFEPVSESLFDWVRSGCSLD